MEGAFFSRLISKFIIVKIHDFNLFDTYIYHLLILNLKNYIQQK